MLEGMLERQEGERARAIDGFYPMRSRSRTVGTDDGAPFCFLFSAEAVSTRARGTRWGEQMDSSPFRSLSDHSRRVWSTARRGRFGPSVGEP